MHTLPVVALALGACSYDQPVAPRNEDIFIGEPPSHTAASAALNLQLMFALADQVTAGAYTPHNHDAQHGATARRFNQGKYATIFLGDDLREPAKGIAMVGTVGSTTAQCTSSGQRHQVALVTIDVDCIDLGTGVRTDSRYTALLVGSGSLPQTLAFAVADQPTAPSYTADSALSSTTGTGAMLITRIGVGDWYVNVGTGSPQGTMYHVNSADVNSVCAIAEWKDFGIRARCFDRGGAPADVPYKVLQVTRGRPGVAFGSVWADQRFPTSTYSPYISFYTSNGVDGSVSVTRGAAGTYQVEFVGAYPKAVSANNVLVTPFGMTFAACTVVSQSQRSTRERQWTNVVDVECRDAAGQLADSRFTMTLIE